MNSIRMMIGTAAGLALLSLAACTTGAEVTPEVNAPEAAASPVEDPQVEDADMQAVPEEPDILIVDEETASTSIDEIALATAVAFYPAGDLDAEEAAALLYMREEEKLAHDVYITLYETWGTQVFQNIANSEQTHTDAVKSLLDRYGLDDPAAGNGIGVFTDPALQELYDQLVATGNESLESALRVGAAIEEIDILDLEERIAQTDNEDIVLVYESLMKGSRNHLRSFVSTLEQQVGAVYEPQYLSQASYDEIINTGVERGGRGRGNGN